MLFFFASPPPSPRQSFLPDASCPTCSLVDTIVTLNRGYLAVLASAGGSELPFVLGGVPAALSAALSAFEAGLIAGGCPPEAAPRLARRQWASCDVWPADPAAGVEWCAAAAAARGVTPGSPGTTLDDASSTLLLPLLLGNASRADASGSDPAARAAAMVVGLLPAPSVAAALGIPLPLAVGAQAYVRHLGASLVGPAYVASVLGAPLGPASGGVVVRRSVRDWLAGWPDPLLSAYAPGPRATVSSANACASVDAMVSALGKPVAAIRGGDHPLVSDLTVTSGEPTATVDARAGVQTYTEVPPWRTLALDGSALAVTGAAEGAIVRVGGALDGTVLGERVGSVRTPLTVFDATLRRPLTLVAEEEEAGNSTSLFSSSTRVKGVAVRRYTIASSSAAPCEGTGGVDRCAAPDAYAWGWRADALYGTATQLSLPRFYKVSCVGGVEGREREERVWVCFVFSTTFPPSTRPTPWPPPPWPPCPHPPPPFTRGPWPWNPSWGAPSRPPSPSRCRTGSGRLTSPRAASARGRPTRRAPPAGCPRTGCAPPTR